MSDERKHRVIALLKSGTVKAFDGLDKMETVIDNKAPEIKTKVKVKWGQARDTVGGWFEHLGQYMQKKDLS